MPALTLQSTFHPTGDQPRAIDALTQGIVDDSRHQVLLGATGTGKTYTIAHVIQNIQKPTLVMAHNKTLAAQLYAEFKDFFPENAVEYFISYYDYYQPEAYVPANDIYIEKETDVNEHIEKLRLSATTSLLSRPDVIIVASVSSIYGLGSPDAYGKVVINIESGKPVRRSTVIRRLVEIHYSRNDTVTKPGTFAIRGDTLEVSPPYTQSVYRIDFFGDHVDKIIEIDYLTAETTAVHPFIHIFPARHFIAESEKLQKAIVHIENELEERITYFKKQEKLLEAQRIEQRTRYDIEMLREVGYCSGIENYSRHLDQRQPGSPPWTLIDYFPPDFLLVIDESHMTVPQIRGMYAGDLSRKTVLVEYGFRLPSAVDNRPLNFDEFQQRVCQTVYTSATPGNFEMQEQTNLVEQIIRPTGLLDPIVEVRPVLAQIDDLFAEIQQRVTRRERILVTTLTKRMAEDLSNYLSELNIRVHYLHSEIDALQRVEILRELRLGIYDVVVGINLLREGLDLPEVSLVAILDADKQGFLRSSTALIQTIGRAARHINGKVLMYADKLTDAMDMAINETNRRRAIQAEHNETHGIQPASIIKSVPELKELFTSVSQPISSSPQKEPALLSTREIKNLIDKLEIQMTKSAESLEFEKAAMIRDRLLSLRRQLADLTPEIQEWELPPLLPRPQSNEQPRSISP